MILLALLIQATPVGAPLPVQTPKVQIGKARRVGGKIIVDYKGGEGQQPVILDPQGHEHKTSPEAPEKSGLTVGQTVSVDMTGTDIEGVVYNMDPKTYNESTWYFVVGGDRIPFRF
jgi:hypothetical protein